MSSLFRQAILFTFLLGVFSFSALAGSKGDELNGVYWEVISVVDNEIHGRFVNTTSSCKNAKFYMEYNGKPYGLSGITKILGNSTENYNYKVMTGTQTIRLSSVNNCEVNNIKIQSCQEEGASCNADNPCCKGLSCDGGSVKACMKDD